MFRDVFVTKIRIPFTDARDPTPTRSHHQGSNVFGFCNRYPSKNSYVPEKGANLKGNESSSNHQCSRDIR